MGGGIAGLAAAVTLVDAGAEVMVLEADRLGGKLRTVPFAGRAVDEGPDAFLARVPDAVDLARAVGLGDRLVAPQRGRAYVSQHGTLVPLPAAQVLGVPADPDAEDLAALLSPEAIARLHDDATTPGAPPAEGADPALGTFIRGRLGDEVADRLVDPLVGGISAGNIDELSLAAAAPQIDALARSTQDPGLVRAAAAVRARPTTSDPVFLAPVDGMAALVDALVGGLRARGAVVFDDVTVRGLERQAGIWRVIADDAARDGVATEETFVLDGVVLAAPAGISGLIVQDHAPVAAAHLRAIRYASVALATFAFEPPSIAGPLEGSGFLVPRSEGLLCTAASWLSSKWERLAPEHGDGTVLVRASAGRSDDRRIAEMDDETLVGTLLEDLAATMGVHGAPAATHLRRWPSSFPQYAPGHLARVEAIEADLATGAPGIAVAGSALRGVGIPASIRSGVRAARRVIAHCTGSANR